jgi:hypothetical protein
VDLPTLGRPTMAMVGTPSMIGVLSELDLIRVMRAVVGRWPFVVRRWLSACDPLGETLESVPFGR